jgi:pSer/pThr/pTyr-binding forkhead associated (FHA) protein
MADAPRRKRPAGTTSGKKPQRPGRLPKAPHSGDKQANIGEKTMIGSVNEVELQASPQDDQRQPAQQDSVVLKVLSRGTVSNFPLKPERISTFIGSQRDSCDIVVNDPAVSKKQLAVIRYENCYILADCGINDLTSFDGVFCRQVVCPIGSRCVINMNMSTIIFDSETPPKNPPRKRFHLDPIQSGGAPPHAKFLVISGERSLPSTLDPVLIGSHSECTLQMRGEGMVPFHALVHWSPEGVCITRLGKGEVVVNGVPVEKAQLINAGDQVQIGPDTLEVQLEGDVLGKCEAMFGGYQLDFNYVRFSAMPHSVCGSFMLPGIGGAIMVGRSSHADITLDDGAVSREHVQIIPNGKSCQIIDNYSANGTYVNTEKVTKARLRSGDRLEVGRSIFVVHYD